MSNSKNVTFTATLIIIDKCQFCSRQLTTKFPGDFPDMFKMCCFCLNWANLLIIKGKETIRDYYKEYGVFTVRKVSNKRLNEIEKRITLVGK